MHTLNTSTSKMKDKPQVLWHVPNKPENISVGRQRIADHIESAGFDVTVRGTTFNTVFRSVHEYGKYDVVLGTTRAGAFAGVALKFLHRKPLIIDHVDPIRQFKESNPRWLASLVRLFENVSFSFANYVLYVYAEERERIDQYTSQLGKTDLGVEIDRFSDPDSDVVTAANDRLAEWEISKNVAIYVGGLEPIYHIEELLMAMPHIPNWSLVIIGDGTLRKMVADTADDCANVHYLGTVPHEEVPGYLHAADVGISLVDDPHTLKVLEYGVSGLSVVQLAGRAEDRFDDLVVYTDLDPRNIAKSIEHASEHNPEGSLESFAAEFDWARIADSYAKVITSVM